MPQDISFMDCIVAVGGLRLWDKVKITYSGMELRVPRRENTLHDQHWLVVGLGWDDAKAVIQAVGGERPHIPVDLARRRIVRVLRAFREYKTYNEIAAMVEISSRHVRRLVAQHVEPGEISANRKIATRLNRHWPCGRPENLIAPVTSAEIIHLEKFAAHLTTDVEKLARQHSANASSGRGCAA